jgi:signal peptidase II
MLRWLWLSALVVALDQATKLWAEAALLGQPPLKVLPHLDLILVYNTGAAFSFLSEAGGWQRWFFVVLALGVTGVLGFWLARLGRGERLSALSLALVIGGALGNLIDRVAYGKVIDFIDVYWDASLHWPAFNIADSAITLGVILLLAESLFGGRETRSTGKTGDS